MALFRTGGGGISETDLWTNPSPTSSFANQAVTLSQSIDNFKYIKVYYRLSDTATNSVSIMAEVSEYKKATGNPNVRVTIGSNNSSGISYARTVRYNSNTEIQISDSSRLGSSGHSNTLAIPTKITGVNL